MDVDSGSRTAVLVCQGRAVADGRLAIGRFRDPVSALLLRPDELALVERPRAGDLPRDWRHRMLVQRVGATGEIMAPRTVAIDDTIRAAGDGQVVLLGAGLDSRPWRLTALAGCVVYSVDHPATQADLRERIGELTTTATRLEFVPVDLTRTPLDAAMSATTHDPTVATTWVWEGVVPYLRPDEVTKTVAEVAARSAPGSTLIVNYQVRAWLTRVGRRMSDVLARATGEENTFAGEPWRSLWSAREMATLLAEHGFIVDRDRDLLAIAREVGSPTTHGRSLSTGRVAVAGFHAPHERTRPGG
jgi:methyltransferase (TIGR00027 family)